MSVNIETTDVRPPTTVSPTQNPPLGVPGRLPEFTLAGKVICVSGGARGLGLTQTEAILEAGAKVYVLDRLPEPVRHQY